MGKSSKKSSKVDAAPAVVPATKFANKKGKREVEVAIENQANAKKKQKGDAGTVQAVEKQKVEAKIQKKIIPMKEENTSSEETDSSESEDEPKQKVKVAPKKVGIPAKPLVEESSDDDSSSDEVVPVKKAGVPPKKLPVTASKNGRVPASKGKLPSDSSDEESSEDRESEEDEKPRGTVAAPFQNLPVPSAKNGKASVKKVESSDDSSSDDEESSDDDAQREKVLPSKRPPATVETKKKSVIKAADSDDSSSDESDDEEPQTKKMKAQPAITTNVVKQSTQSAQKESWHAKKVRHDFREAAPILLRSANVETCFYDGAEIKEDPWAEGDELPRPPSQPRRETRETMPPSQRKRPTLFTNVEAAGEASSSRGPQGKTEGAVPERGTTDNIGYPWVVTTEKWNDEFLQRDDSLIKDHKLGHSLLSLTCLPADMAESPASLPEGLDSLYFHLARAGQIVVGLRMSLIKAIDIGQHWEARAKRAEDRLLFLKVPETVLEEDKDVSKLVVGLKKRLDEEKKRSAAALDNLKEEHRQELIEKDASAFSQGQFAAEGRLRAQLADVSEVIHRDSFLQGWNARASTEEPVAEHPEVPPFKMPDWSPPDLPHWKKQ